MQYDNDQRLWLTPKDYYHVPLVPIDHEFLLAAAWDLYLRRERYLASCFRKAPFPSDA